MKPQKNLVVLIFPNTTKVIYDLFPLKIPYIGATFSTLLLAYFGAKIGNRFFCKDVNKQLEKSIIKVGDALELLLLSSNRDATMLQFSLKNDKFYIGWVRDLPIPQVTNYVRIIPAFSGYRDAQKRLNFTTEYVSVYQGFIDEGAQHLVDEYKFDLVLKLDDIVSVARFDIDLYERFNAEETTNGALSAHSAH